MKGKLYIVGLGPGDKGDMTSRAVKAIEGSDIIVGYTTYVNLIREMIQGKRVITTGMRRERERCEKAVFCADRGNRVCIVSSGDPGVYGMAGLVLEIIAKQNSKIEVEIIPGVTSATAGGALLGAPLMNDFAVISLSDLLTPWDVIQQRIRAAARSDFVIVLYNPMSKKRRKHIEKAREIILNCRKPETPVGIVKNIGREGETVIVTDLQHMLEYQIDMVTTVIIGNSSTFVKNDRMITPRGYEV
ncbi:MAG: precorrin-3B C(17)-methyltransferase [Firmicutes bacterium]|nr:precorrin-3B C(17)-methyltransferase [Bacillota bacterium]